MSTASILAINAAAAAGLFVVTWVVSLRLADVSIVDVVWGLGFVVVTGVSHQLGRPDGRADLVFALVTVWGLRLAGYLWWRNRGKGEDRRYAAMRHRTGEKFRFTSLLTVFLLQAALVWIVSLPEQLALSGPTRHLGPWEWIGATLCAAGIAIEGLADSQLASFKANPEHRGQVLRTGLWGWSRHPNYFGEVLVWWGLFLVCVRVPGAWWGLIGPLVITFLLLRVSGVTLVERSMAKRHPGYSDYQRSTSAFFPLPPRSRK